MSYAAEGCGVYDCYGFTELVDVYWTCRSWPGSGRI